MEPSELGPDPSLVSSPADLADLLDAIGPTMLAEAYPEDWIGRYRLTPRQCRVLARRHWRSSEDELLAAYQATAEANERRALRPEPEAAPAIASVMVRRPTHRVGHRGGVAWPRCT